MFIFTWELPFFFFDYDVDYVLQANRVFNAHSVEARILENSASFRAKIQPILNEFEPDVIHCNDRQTFMPFRFDTNVLYSSHLFFCDLLGLQGINDEYLQELKIERCALANASIFVVYSKFARERALSQIRATCCPVVLPLAINQSNSYEKKDLTKIKVAYFGRFENMQKGFLEYVDAVKLIHKKLPNSICVEFSLYGKGEVPSFVNKELFVNIDFLQGQSLFDAYAETDIVVMPSRYEPFGLTGLEAMASGCLLLVTEGLGMDEYAQPGKNCFSIPSNGSGIANVLYDAIINYDKYESIRLQGKKDSISWTWKRCVEAHYIFYKAISKRRKENVEAAFSSKRNAINNTFIKTKSLNLSINERDLLAEINKKKCLNPIDNTFFITLDFNFEESPLKQCLSVMKKWTDGVQYHLEFLPFEDKSFECVCVICAWETVINPKLALQELFRITKKTLVVCYYTGDRLPWQTLLMEGVESFYECGIPDTWRVESVDKITDLFSLVIFNNIKFS